MVVLLIAALNGGAKVGGFASAEQQYNNHEIVEFDEPLITRSL
jgi:hypothetical protein